MLGSVARSWLIFFLSLQSHVVDHKIGHACFLRNSSRVHPSAINFEWRICKERCYTLTYKDENSIKACTLQIITRERTRLLSQFTINIDLCFLKHGNRNVWLSNLKTATAAFWRSLAPLACGILSPSGGCCQIKCELQSPNYLPNPLRKKVGLATGKSTVWGKSRLVSRSEVVMWVTGAHTKECSKFSSTYCFKRCSTMLLLSRYTRWRGWVSGWHVICHHFPELLDGKENLPPRGATTENIDLCFRTERYESCRLHSREKLMVRMNDFLVLVPHIVIVASWPLSAPSFLLVGAREGVLAHSLSQKTDTCVSCWTLTCLKMMPLSFWRSCLSVCKLSRSSGRGAPIRTQGRAIPLHPHFAVSIAWAPGPNENALLHRALWCGAETERPVGVAAIASGAVG